MTRDPPSRRHDRRAPSSSTATLDRSDWSVRGPLCEGWPIHDLQWDPSSGVDLRRRRSARGTGRPCGGATTSGRRWTHSSEGLTYGDDGAEKITTVWNVAPARRHRSYAGVEPAGLFRSDDGGATWTHVEGLTNHPSRPTGNRAPAA